MRVVSAQYPAYFSHDAWVSGFDRFLDELGLDTVHLYGVSLGGFLAQFYCELRPTRVASLVLTNAFANTDIFSEGILPSGVLQWTPGFYLKKMILNNFPQEALDPEISDSVDFSVRQLESLSQQDLASRLTLTAAVREIGPLSLNQAFITIIDSLDSVALPQVAREVLHKKYPGAKMAHLKMGGNFPMLANAEEVNMYIVVHLRNVGAIDMPKPVDVGDDSDADVVDEEQGVVEEAKEEEEKEEEEEERAEEPAGDEEDKTEAQEDKGKAKEDDDVGL